MDVIWSSSGTRIAIEAQSAARWRREWGAPGRELVARGIVDRAVGVYLGEATVLDLDGFRVLPLYVLLAAVADFIH